MPRDQTLLRDGWKGSLNYPRSDRLRKKTQKAMRFLHSPFPSMLAQQNLRFLSPRTYRPTDDDGDVVGSAVVESILEELLADLPGRLHRRQSLGNSLVADMSGQAVAAKQVDVLPRIPDSGDHRRRLRSADRAGEDVGEGRVCRERRREKTLVDQRLGDRLIVGYLGELAVGVCVVA